MLQPEIIKEAAGIVGDAMVHLDASMQNHTTFRVGGPADLLVEPATIAQISLLSKLFQEREIPYLILGNGSNVLVGDGGIRGVVIKIGKAFSACEADGVCIKAEAGIKLSRLANFALEKELTGLEFAAGIPGTLGGALFMNAGAYGGEMAQVVETVTYLDNEGKVATIKGDACRFGYRTSVFEQNPGWIILGCTLCLKDGNAAEIRAQMDDLANRRISKQPLHLPSAGSTFKRPEGHFAGKLIQDAGLMGFRVGGASVSEKHAGFVVNDQNATAKDIRTLIEEVQKRVYDAFGVSLLPEVRFIGEF